MDKEFLIIKKIVDLIKEMKPHERARVIEYVRQKMMDDMYDDLNSTLGLPPSREPKDNN